MIKLLSLFSGIGAFEKALTNLGVQYELVNYCEIDKYASKSYSAIHGVPESKNLWDVTKVDVLNLPKDIDLLTYGFPCQDISLAGKQKGMFNEDGSLTRSGLFFKALDVIECVKPKIAIAENVKALTSKKFTEEFKIVLDSLEKAGYHNYWKVLNAKDYGIPQNRERVFIVSIRKDIDHNIFEFPKPYSLEKRLKDFLEPHVDEKYYLSDKMISYLTGVNQAESKFPRGERFIDTLKMTNEKGIAATINSKAGTRPVDNFVLQDTDRIMVVGKSKSGGERSLILDEDGISNCLSATDYKQPKQILIREKTKKGYTEAQDGDGVYINRPEQKRGTVQKDMIQTITTFQERSSGERMSENIIKYINKQAKHQQDLIQCSDGLCRTIPAGTHGSTPHLLKTVVDYQPLRIRKLTPKECYRLMGFSDDDFEKSESVPTSNTQLYKQAGNSIVVDVLEELMCMMLDTENNLLV